jgi:hypothetical protein
MDVQKINNCINKTQFIMYYKGLMLLFAQNLTLGLLVTIPL